MPSLYDINYLHTQKILTAVHNAPSFPEQQNLPYDKVVLMSSFIFRRSLDAAVTAGTFWALKPCRALVMKKHHLILHVWGPILRLDHGSGWVGNGPVKHRNTFDGGFPFYSLSTNSVPYGELAKGRGQMSGDIIVTMLTACKFIHQKVITLCSGKNLF